MSAWWTSGGIRRRCGAMAAPEVERLLRLYRERYRGFNVRHFHQIARREHGVTVSYSFLKQTLQAAGLVKKHRARGPASAAAEPRACFGELLHIDGSPHAWLALRPTARAVLIAVLDDATKRVLYAQLWPGETTVAIMTALRDVITTHGLPMALYTDRAHWAFNTPQAKGPVESTPAHAGRPRAGAARASSTSRPTRRRRAAAASGSIARSRIAWSTSSASPRSRRSRPPMRICAIGSSRTTTRRSVARRRIRRAPSSRSGSVDLEQILCHQEERRGGAATTPSPSMAAPSSSPANRAAARAPACRSRSADISTGEYSIWSAARRLGRYPAVRRAPARSPHGRAACGSCRSRGRQERAHRPLENAQSAFSTAPTGLTLKKRSDHLSNGSGQITCQQQTTLRRCAVLTRPARSRQ